MLVDQASGGVNPVYPGNSARIFAALLAAREQRRKHCYLLQCQAGQPALFGKKAKRHPLHIAQCCQPNSQEKRDETNKNPQAEAIAMAPCP